MSTIKIKVSLGIVQGSEYVHDSEDVHDLEDVHDSKDVQGLEDVQCSKDVHGFEDVQIRRFPMVGKCQKDLKYKTNTFVWKMIVIIK